ncbi:hypothetical protein CRYUN_Cryun21dG0041600 [Craigia yunnanensis]
MSSSFTFHIPKALPSISHRRTSAFYNITSKHKPINNPRLYKKLNVTSIKIKPSDYIDTKKTSLVVQVAALLATFEQPALAVTGIDNEPDLITVIIQLGIIACCYFLIMPPIIMNWLRIRWYRRNLLEMYFQFLCLLVLSWSTALGTISKLQEIPSGSILEVSMGYT